MTVLKNEYESIQKHAVEAAVDSTNQQALEDEAQQDRTRCCCSASVVPEDSTPQHTCCSPLHQLATHPWFERTFIIAILLNTIVLTAAYEGMSSTYEEVILHNHPNTSLIYSTTTL